MPRSTMMLSRWLCLTLVSMIICTVTTTEHDARLPDGFEFEPMMTRNAANKFGMYNTIPLQTVFLSDGRILVVGKEGNIWIGNTHQPQDRLEFALYLHLPNCYSKDDIGLLSILVEQDQVWSEQPSIYVFWAHKPPEGHNGMRISKFKHNENQGHLSSRADLQSEQVLWQDPDGFPLAINNDPTDAKEVLWHYGGQLQWGPGNHLYLGMGDKYLTDLVLNQSSVAGCIIRITKSGSIPNGNMDSGIKPKECWAYGLRNPYRMWWAMDEGVDTSRLYIAEIGGNDHWVAMEDIHMGEAGKNYGWPFCEGPCDNPQFPECNCADHDDPVYSYPHNGQTACIIGGFEYDRENFPKSYHGAYFFVDYISHDIQYFTLSDTKRVRPKRFATLSGHVNDLSIDPWGHIWTIDSPMRSWVLSRIKYESDSLEIKNLVASPTSGEPGLDVSFVVTYASPNMTDESISFAWEFDDETPTQLTTTPNTTHEYMRPGLYNPQVFVRTEKGFDQSAFAPVAIGTPPMISLVGGDAEHKFFGGEEITFEAVSVAANGKDLSRSIVWTALFIHEDHYHEYESNIIGNTYTFHTPTSGHAFNGKSGFLISAVSHDEFTLHSTLDVHIYPQHTTLRIETTPTALPVMVDGAVWNAPCEWSSIVAFTHAIEVEKIVYVNNDDHDQTCLFWGWEITNNTADSDTIAAIDSDVKFWEGQASVTAVGRLQTSTLHGFYNCTSTSSFSSLGHHTKPTSILTCDELGWPIPSFQGTTEVCAFSKVRENKCSKDVTHVEAVDMCDRNGARLCTIQELQLDVTKGTGCNLDELMVWTSHTCKGGAYVAPATVWASVSAEFLVSATQCIPHNEGRFPVRCCADRSVPTTSTSPFVPQHGTGTTLSPTSAKTMAPLQVSERTCADLAIKFSPRNSVCGIRKVDSGKCVKQPVSFNEALMFCENMGAKLCSLQETLLNVGKGCNKNQKRVWTRDRCGSDAQGFGFSVIGASTRYRKTPNQECVIDVDAQHHVQCCLDVTLDISSEPLTPTTSDDAITSTLTPSTKGEASMYDRHSLGLPRGRSEFDCNTLGWVAAKQSTINSVCATSVVRTDGACIAEPLTFYTSRVLCESVGARLCSPSELQGDVARSVACGLNAKRVWTKESCDGGYLTSFGSSKMSGPSTCESGEQGLAYVRCCADDSSV
eukprot:m.143678 g.143678  ORF g.143678 m.143678 type:complete len:1176 (-) comp30330_c0_seq1:27-3554(-)